ncbi:hypothetical protein JTB14_015587 [Gonioctena quinquepunctata]|nr:hypothetical protein JTB14_015587 [Gonioctena quinquepunctata]
MLGKCIITNADFRRNDLPTKNVEQYISGYLLRKCSKKHSCEVCQDYAKATDTLDSAKLFCHYKGDTDKYGKREGNCGKLLMPEDSFVDYVSLMEKILMENVSLWQLEKQVNSFMEN